jgi:hypothetical protein
VYGGGAVGLMGTGRRRHGRRRRSGRDHPESLMNAEIGHKGLTAWKW